MITSLPLCLLPPPKEGWSGAILLNSPVGCELRRDRSAGKRDGLCGGPCRRKVGGWATILNHAHLSHLR